MMENHVQAALFHFSKYFALLETDSVDIEEGIYTSTNQARARFLLAVLDEVATPNATSDSIILGGLRLVVDPTVSILPYSIFSMDVESPTREIFAQRLYDCFEKLFAIKCRANLSVDNSDYSGDWESLCFMWWELLPRHGIPFEEYLRGNDLTLLSVMQRVLMLDNNVCKKSALHGLGLWHIAYPDEVRAIIQGSVHTLPAELKSYALAAESGNIQ